MPKWHRTQSLYQGPEVDKEVLYVLAHPESTITMAVTSSPTPRRLRIDRGKYCISAHPNNIPQAFGLRRFEFRHPRAAAEQSKSRCRCSCFRGCRGQKTHIPYSERHYILMKLQTRSSGKKYTLGCTQRSWPSVERTMVFFVGDLVVSVFGCFVDEVSDGAEVLD